MERETFSTCRFFIPHLIPMDKFYPLEEHKVWKIGDNINRISSSLSEKQTLVKCLIIVKAFLVSSTLEVFFSLNTCTTRNNYERLGRTRQKHRTRTIYTRFKSSCSIPTWHHIQVPLANIYRRNQKQIINTCVCR